MESLLPNFDIKLDHLDADTSDDELLKFVNEMELGLQENNESNLTPERAESKNTAKTMKTTRFVELSSEEVDDIVARSATKNTTKNTKWGVYVFEGELYL